MDLGTLTSLLRIDEVVWRCSVLLADVDVANSFLVQIKVLIQSFCLFGLSVSRINWLILSHSKVLFVLKLP